MGEAVGDTSDTRDHSCGGARTVSLWMCVTYLPTQPGVFSSSKGGRSPETPGKATLVLLIHFSCGRCPYPYPKGSSISQGALG